LTDADLLNNQLLQSADKEDEAKGNLEARVQELEKARKEDWFLFIVVLMMIFDAWCFARFSTLAAPLVIFALQIIVLVVTARRLSVPEPLMLIYSVREYFMAKARAVDDPQATRKRPETKDAG